jgi:acyl-coenzyme A thioesterase PaaI-like protein
MFKFNLGIDFSSPIEFIKTAWKKFQKIPGGKNIFSYLISYIIPYTGSISPVVLLIETGRASVLLKDKKFLRNHLNSIHAIALANLGEFSTGLCINYQLPKNAKSILTKIEVEYIKKARGELTSDAIFSLPVDLKNNTTYKVTALITNSEKELVAKVDAQWRIRIY